ncbi:hypothetical protein [Glycomyces arizonensis]|uniref:hypothetical protein n=1 Tax=Glycomyces arizonensis TaxID=256035 RepID=UPI00040BDAA9|nr:hypothetical protein [Glycomyces arizonensis]
MSTPYIVIAAASLVGLAALAVIVWVVCSLAADTRADRQAPQCAASGDLADRLCRGEVDADLAALAEATEPLDIVDRPRAVREIHHMTAAEFTEMNRQFHAIVAENWPNQT